MDRSNLSSNSHPRPRPRSSAKVRGAVLGFALLTATPVVAAGEVADARAARAAVAAQGFPSQGSFEAPATWPGQAEEPDPSAHDGFAAAFASASLGDPSGGGFAWQPTFYGPGLTREPMVASEWDDGSGPALYVGGQLLTAGPHGTFGIARWDGGEWSPLGIGVNGPVRAMTVYQGDLIVAGAFTEAATEAGEPVTVNRIARWDGSQWSALGAGFPSPQLAIVLAVTVYEGDLIAGGAWLPAAGQPTSWIARWDGSEWSPFDSGPNQAVWDLTVYEGDLVAGGSFTRAGGQVVNGIARWDGSAWAPLGTGMNSAVVRLRVFDGDLIAGGGFTEAGGVFAGRIARWDGSAWTSLGAGLAGTPSPHIRDLELFAGELIASGRFTHAGGQPVNHVARWDGSAWAPLSGPAGDGVGGLVWQGLDDGTVSTVSVFDGALIAGGEFYTAGGERANYIAQWDGAAWSRLAEAGTGLVNFSRDNNASVRALTTYDGDLIVGGGFDDAGILPGAARVARWDGTQWSPLGTGIDLPFPAFGNEVNALAGFAGDLIVGGGFGQAGGAPGTSRIARWDGSAWSALGGGIAGGDVQAMVELDGDLIAAGTFTSAGGTAVDRIARWDGSAWSPLGGGLNETVNGLAVYQGDLIATGSFTTAGGVAAQRVARWDGASWSPLGTGVNDAAWAVTVYDGDLIVAGFFTSAGGVPVNQIARWDGTSWSPLGGGFSSPPGAVSPRVSALTVFGGDLYAAGLFTSADGGGESVTVNHIARWDGERWWPLAGPRGVGAAGEPNFPWLFALATYDADGSGPLPEKLIAGGFHLVSGGAASWGLGVYGPVAFTAAPDRLDFGAVIVGQTGGPLALTLSNNSGDPVTIDQVSDPGAPFAAAGGTCGPAPITLPAGATCTLEYDFSPASAGTAAAEITITSDAPGGPHLVTLQGIGSTGSIAGTPDPLDFGVLPVGATGDPLRLTLLNADAVTVNVNAVSPPAAPFHLVGGTCGTAPFDLDPGAGCTLELTFEPTVDGDVTDIVEVHHDGSGSPASFGLAGDGVERQLTVGPGLLDFGTVPTGASGGPLTLGLTNPGTVPVTVSSVSAPEAPFATAGTTCGPLPFVLAAGASCGFDYVFLPVEPEAASQTLTINSDVAGSPHTVDLQGTGTGAVLVAEPGSLAASLPPDATEVAPLTIGNPGDATLEWQVTEEGGPGGAESTISHSASSDIVAGNGIACIGGLSTLENHYLRLFALDDFGLAEGLHVREVTFGLEFLDATVPVDVNLYTVDGELTFDNLVPIGGTTVTLEPQQLTSVTVSVSGFAPAGSVLVVEILPPHLGNLGRFFPGSNALGESAPSYWAAPECGIDEPVTFESAGWPGVHLVIEVRGEVQVGCDLPTWAQAAPPSGSLPAGADQVVDVTFDSTDLAPGPYTANLCLGSNDGVRPLTVVPLALTVEEVAAPALAFEPAILAFGDVEVGSTSPPLMTMLTNSGDADATALTLDLSGDGFAADTSGCTATLPAGESCPVSVTFSPAEPGPVAGSLQASSAEGALAAAELSGNGVGDGGFTPMALEVDPQPLSSDGNRVFEPGEQVDAAPAWRNDGAAAHALGGTAAAFTGPDGADYTIAGPTADYGLIDAGTTASCLETGVCYALEVDDPAARPAQHWDAAFEETLDDTGGTAKTWTVHIGGSFVDVPSTNLFYPAIEGLLHSGVTGGCSSDDVGRRHAFGARYPGPTVPLGGAAYCPADRNSRAQMAVFMLKAADGPDYDPPACVDGAEMFTDVPFDSAFCPWIEELARRNVVAGCGSGNYCPGDPVSRAQMSVFLLKSLAGGDYTPPTCGGIFDDVTCPSLFADWVEDLAARAITGGCSETRYCPGEPVTRAQMAVFVTRTFGLTLYGP